MAKAIEEGFEDPGDRAEREFFEKKPLLSKILTTKGYADIIKHHLRNHEVKEAIDVLEVRMIKEDRVKPENYIYNLLISELGRLGYAKKAFSLYNRMKQRALRVTGATYTALFNSCAMSPFRKDALWRAHHLRKVMLEKGYEPNASNYNAMIKAFGRCGDVETAFLLMDEMKEKRVPFQGVRTFNFLLQAAASDPEHGFRHALLVWHKIYRHGLRPDIYSFNMMLHCTRNCGIGDVETVKQLIGDILLSSKKGLPPPSTYTIDKEKQGDKEILMIGTKSKTKSDIQTVPKDEIQVSGAIERKDELPNLLARLPHLGSLVALGEIRTAEERFAVIGGLHGFLKEMDIAKEIPNVKTFSQILDVIPQTYEAEKDVLKLMRNYGVRTDVDFFNLLMKRRCLRFDYRGAEVCTQLDCDRFTHTKILIVFFFFRKFWT